MKKLFATAAFLMIGGIALMSQTPPPPPDNPSGDGNGPVGGGAPIAGGIGILLALGAAYGGKKVWDFRKKSLTD